jgi:hypothetical protein
MGEAALNPGWPGATSPHSSPNPVLEVAMSNRHHMDHLRGATLHKGDRVIFNDLELYLGSHEKSNHRMHYHGYFMIPSQEHLEEGVQYKLVLADHREADVTLGELKGCEAQGGALHAVEFHVVGQLRGGARRGLDTHRQKLSS